MGKVLKIVAGIGLAFLAPYAAPLLVASGVAAGVAAAVTTAVMAVGASMALSSASALLFGPKVPRTQLSRLNVSLDPSTPRKIVFGTTAMPLDLRYHEVSGTDQEYMDYIIATSAHKVTSIDEIWFEDKQAWTASGGVTARYSGYLTVAVRTEGTSANTIAINGGAKWGSTRRLTGCSYIHLRIQRTGLSKRAESPLVQGLPSRVTVRGNGASLYDPRKDSTVSGGSGTHRADNQATWGVYTDPDDCDNPALQLLWYLLGWKINNILSVGCGVPYTRIDLASFITAANICDEAITLSGGGTQKRYRTSGTASDSDDRMDMINTFLSCMNGTLRDNDGKLTLTVMKNDLASYTLSFDDDDILDSFEWNQTRGLTDTYNVARGRYVDPSDNSLYQLVDYPEVRITSPDGIERVMTLDLPFVEDGKRAQRIAKQVLQRNQYRGMFSATFTAKALGCQVGDVVRLTFTPLGWTNKLFRVVSQQIDFTGKVPMALVEENAAIYAWDAEEAPPVVPVGPTVYDPLNNPFILAISDAEAIADGRITSFFQTSAPAGTAVGDIWFDTDDGNKMYRWNGAAWVDAQDTEITTAISAAADAQATADGKVTTFFQATTPTAEAVGDLWMDSDDKNKMYRWNGASWVSVRDAGKVTTFYSTTTPTAEAIGDLWYNSDTLVLKRWNGSAWQDTATYGATSAQISAIDAAQSSADAAYALADGKIETYFQTTAPTGASFGDLWFDTDDQNKLYRYNGTSWVLAQDGAIGDAITAAAGAQATADSKIVTFFATATPTAEAIGDLWYNSSTLLLKRWSGSAWVDTATNGAPSGTTVGGRDADTVAGTIKTDGSINDNKVNTASVSTNAITKTTTVASSTGVTILRTTDPDPVNWTLIQSASFTTNGGELIVTANFNAICQEGSTSTVIRYGVEYNIYINSVNMTQNAVAHTSFISGITNYFAVPISITTLRSGLSAGSYTVYVYARRIGSDVAGSGATTSNATRSLVITEFKR